MNPWLSFWCWLLQINGVCRHASSTLPARQPRWNRVRMRVYHHLTTWPWTLVQDRRIVRRVKRLEARLFPEDDP